MGCCGKNRSIASAPGPGFERGFGNSPASPSVVTRRTPSAQYFEYVGKTGLTAFGPVTGRHYRFPRPGALLAVDERDASSMAGVPHLRRAAAPE